MPRSHPPLALAVLLACTSTAADPGGPTSADTAASTSTTAPPDLKGVPTTTAPDPPGTSSTGGIDPSTSTTGTSTTTLDTTSAATSTGSTGVLLECGDGEISPGEECDLGHGLNKDDGECSLNCQLSICGDGRVWKGVEECDAGPDNSPDYGGCTPQCKLGPHCGDGSVQGSEECDLGIKNGTGEQGYIDGVPCSDTCRHVALLVFISSATYSAPQLGGSTGADARCQELAASAGLNNAGAFKAWISDWWGSVNARFKPAVAGMPYVLPGGLRIADDRAQLFASGPLVGITGSELGQTLLKAWVWTNTTPDGEMLDDDLDCLDWTKDSFLLKARVGRSGVDKQDLDEWNTWKSGNHWTSYATYGCDHKYHLYCFEQ